MGSGGTADYRRRRKEAERRRRTPREPKRADASDGEGLPPERRAAATDCAWCGGPITPRKRGPIPKWCSATCRHRAWEQTRAAASGQSAVKVVERRVEVPTAKHLTRQDWPQALKELAHQLDHGRIYDRDLLQLSDALSEVLAACNRRPRIRSGALERERLVRARRQARGSYWQP